jgi:hypothetical protein
VLGFRLPLEPDSTIIASVRWAGSLHLRVEEIAASPEVAQKQAAALSTLVMLARSFAAPLGSNTANNSLREFLENSEVSQQRNRVVVTAVLPAGFIAGLVLDEKAAPAAQGTGK